MSIVCLGWGSLVWDPRCLPIEGDWHSNGPNLPIEFARESMDGRITLVLTEGVTPVKSCWVKLAVTSLDEGKARLAQREGICESNIKYSIGFWDKGGKAHGRCKGIIGDWACSAEVDTVVWTNLRCGFKGLRDRLPTADEVVCHLRDLDEGARRKAEDYVRCTPRQVRTKYRAQIEAALGWVPFGRGPA